MNPPPVPIGKAKNTRGAKAKSKAAVPFTPKNAVGNSNDVQDTPMTDVGYHADDDQTPRPPPTLGSFSRQYPVVWIIDEEEDFVQIQYALVGLRELHLLHSFQDGVLRSADLSWDTPESGMLGVSELTGITTNFDVCEDLGYKAEEMMRLAHKTANTRNTHEFVIEAADRIMNYLRDDHEDHVDRCEFVRSQLEPVKSALNKMTITEDAKIKRKKIKEVYHQDRIVLVELVERAFDVLREHIDDSTHDLGVLEMRRIAAEFNFAASLGKSRIKTARLNNLPGKRKDRAKLLMNYTYAINKILAMSKDASNALLSITLGILGPLVKCLQDDKELLGDNYAQLEDYPPLVSPLKQVQPKTPVLLTSTYFDKTPNPNTIKSIHVEMRCTPKLVEAPSTKRASIASVSSSEFSEPETPTRKRTREYVERMIADGSMYDYAAAGLEAIREADEEEESESETSDSDHTVVGGREALVNLGDGEVDESEDEELDGGVDEHDMESECDQAEGEEDSGVDDVYMEETEESSEEG